MTALFCKSFLSLSSKFLIPVMRYHARGADGRHRAAPVSASGSGLARGVRTSWAHPHPHGAREQRGRVHEQCAAHAPGTAPPGEPGHAGSQTGILELPPLYAWQTAWGVSVPTARTPPPDGRLVGALADGSRSIGAKTVNSRSYAVRQSRCLRCLTRERPALGSASQLAIYSCQT